MTGEERHERCRHGRLTPAWASSGADDPQPTVIPLCGWELPEACPPAARRAWVGNAIETDDCAVCPAYAPL